MKRMKLNEQMMNLYNYFDYIPEGRFLNEVLNNVENPETPEEFMEAYCVLKGTPIKPTQFIEVSFMYDDCDYKKEPPYKYGLPDRLQFMI